MPKVSVIIPTFNRSQLISESIDSVFSQTYKNFEIIIIDDGSTDNTKKVIEYYIKTYGDKIRYFYQDNQGAASARNKGLDVARGEYIAFLDTDDIWLPKKLEKQVNILDECKEISLVYSNVIIINDHNKVINSGLCKRNFLSGKVYEKTLLWRVGCGSPPTWLVRKKCFDEIGKFDPDFVMAHDRDMIIRLSKEYQMYGIKEPLVKIRQHKLTSRVRGIPAEKKEYYHFKLLNKLFKRIDPSLNIRIRKKMISHYFFLSGLAYLKEMDIISARRKFFESFRNYPYKCGAYCYFALTFLGSDFLKNIIRARRAFLTIKH